MEATELDADDTEVHAQYRAAFTENFELVLDILDVMRDESVHMGYWQEAGFVASVEEVLRSFACTLPRWIEQRGR